MTRWLLLPLALVSAAGILSWASLVIPLFLGELKWWENLPTSGPVILAPYSLPLGCVARTICHWGVTDRDLRFMVSADEVQVYKAGASDGWEDFQLIPSTQP